MNPKEGCGATRPDKACVRDFILFPRLYRATLKAEAAISRARRSIATFRLGLPRSLPPTSSSEDSKGESRGTSSFDFERNTPLNRHLALQVSRFSIRGEL